MYILIINPERCLNLSLRSQGTRARRWFRGCLKSRVGECSSSLLAVPLFVWQRYTRGKTMSLHLFYCLSGNQETHWLLPERQEAQRPAAQAGERRMAVLRDCRPGRDAALRADTDLRGLRNLSSNILGQAELCPAESAAAPLPGFAGFRNDGGPGSGWRRDTRETTPSRNRLPGSERSRRGPGHGKCRGAEEPRSRRAEGPNGRVAEEDGPRFGIGRLSRVCLAEESRSGQHGVAAWCEEASVLRPGGTPGLCGRALGRPTSAAGWWSGACAPESRGLTLWGERPLLLPPPHQVAPLSRGCKPPAVWGATPATRSGNDLDRWLGWKVLRKSSRALIRGTLMALSMLATPHPPYTNSTQAVGGCGTRIRFFLQRKPSSCILFLELLCATEFLFKVWNMDKVKEKGVRNPGTIHSVQYWFIYKDSLLSLNTWCNFCSLRKSWEQNRLEKREDRLETNSFFLPSYPTM